MRICVILFALLCAATQAHTQPSIRLIDSAKKSWMPEAKGSVGLRFRNVGTQPLIVTSGSIRSSAKVFKLLTSFTTPKIVAAGDSSYIIVEVNAQIAYEYFAYIDLLTNDPAHPVASFALRVNDSIPPNPVRTLTASPLKDGLLNVSWQAPDKSRDNDSIVFYRAFIITKTGENEEIYNGKGNTAKVKSKFEGDVFVSVLAYDDMGNRSAAFDTTWIDRSKPKVRITYVDQQFPGVPEHIERGNPQFALSILDWHMGGISAYWREPGASELNLISQLSTFSQLKEVHSYSFKWNTSQLRGKKELVLISQDLVDNADTSVYAFTVSQVRGWPKRMLNHGASSTVTIADDEGGRFIMTGADIANGVYRPNGHHYYYNWPWDITRALVDRVVTAAADFDGDRKSEIIALTKSDKVLIMDHHGMTEREFGDVTFNERYASVIKSQDSAYILAGAAPVAIRNETGSYLLFGGSQSWRPDGSNADLDRPLEQDGVREKDRFVIANLIDQRQENLVQVHDYGQWEELSIRNTFGKQEAGPFRIWQANGSYKGFFPSIGDIDGDNDLEIIIPAANDSLYAFHHDGATVDHYPVHLMTSTSGRNQAMIADVNADGVADIILPVEDSIVAISGKLGSIIQNEVWPIKRIGPGTSLISIADVNSDGYLELIEPPAPGDTSWVYVYDLGVRNEPGTIEWGTFQHDMMRTGNYNTPVKALQSGVDKMPTVKRVMLEGRTLRVEEGHQVCVSDILGRPVAAGSNSSGAGLDLSDLPSGVYFVAIDELEVIKIVL
jgi:hypothetical protein